MLADKRKSWDQLHQKRYSELCVWSISWIYHKFLHCSSLQVNNLGAWYGLKLNAKPKHIDCRFPCSCMLYCGWCCIIKYYIVILYHNEQTMSKQSNISCIKTAIVYVVWGMSSLYVHDTYSGVSQEGGHQGILEKKHAQAPFLSPRVLSFRSGGGLNRRMLALFGMRDPFHCQHGQISALKNPLSNRCTLDFTPDF